MYKFISLLVAAFLLPLSTVSLAADSSSIAPVPSQAKVMECYGTSQTSQYAGSEWDSSWYRCDGWETSSGAHNTYVRCPSGYVQKGVYLWQYTDGWGANISRCRVVCQQVTTYQPQSNCAWR